MAKDTGDSASQLVQRLANDPQFRETVNTAPTLHDKAQLIRAAGYGDVSLDAVQAALKAQLSAMGAGVQVDPERVRRTEELFIKAATDQELQQALRAAGTPEAKREVLAQAGYGDITLDDLKAVAADLGQREELSDAELELVSGGKVEVGLGETLGTFGGAGVLIGSAAGPPGAVVGAIIGLGIGAAAYAIANAPPPSDW
jgi:predicted ribosomally synthesized peptide with nif11-like leader